MITQFEKWLFAGIGFIIVAMIVAGGLAMKSAKECRLELAKAGRSADEIIKICP
jgi:hypothetical protein